MRRNKSERERRTQLCMKLSNVFHGLRSSTRNGLLQSASKMKKLTTLYLEIFFILGLSSCGNNEPESSAIIEDTSMDAFKLFEVITGLSSDYVKDVEHFSHYSCEYSSYSSNNTSTEYSHVQSFGGIRNGKLWFVFYGGQSVGDEMTFEKIAEWQDTKEFNLSNYNYKQDKYSDLTIVTLDYDNPFRVNAFAKLNGGYVFSYYICDGSFFPPLHVVFQNGSMCNEKFFASSVSGGLYGPLSWYNNTVVLGRSSYYIYSISGEKVNNDNNEPFKLYYLSSNWKLIYYPISMTTALIKSTAEEIALYDLSQDSKRALWEISNSEILKKINVTFDKDQGTIEKTLKSKVSDTVYKYSIEVKYKNFDTEDLSYEIDIDIVNGKIL